MENRNTYRAYRANLGFAPSVYPLSMRVRLLAACLCLAALAVGGEDYSSSEWRGEIERGYLPYLKLTFDDFAISDGVATPHWMNTKGFVHYTYRATVSVDGGLYQAKVAEISIRSGFDANRSWRRSSVPEQVALLQHEQGHLDINEIHAADMRKLVLPTGTGYDRAGAFEDLAERLKAEADKISDESQAEQDKYDSETKHGTDHQQQEFWTSTLRKRLRELKIVYWNRSQ